MQKSLPDFSSCRDEAYAELATAYSDMDTLQATLADSATYVRYLRKRVLELELEQSRHSAARTMSGQQDEGGSLTGQQDGVFSSVRIKAAIVKAVQEACACQEEERRRRLRQLQLRWHPGEIRVLLLRAEI